MVPFRNLCFGSDYMYIYVGIYIFFVVVITPFPAITFWISVGLLVYN